VDPFIMLCCDGHFLHGLWPPSNSLGFVSLSLFCDVFLTEFFVIAV
jgi:hypothetical protein